MLRLIETLVPESSHAELQHVLADADVVELWQEPVMDERMLVRVLVEADKVEPVRPRTWWEADQARRATRRAFLIWTVLLVVLVVLIWLS
jgi:hypothetical protein